MSGQTKQADAMKKRRNDRDNRTTPGNFRWHDLPVTYCILLMSDSLAIYKLRLRKQAATTLPS